MAKFTNPWIGYIQRSYEQIKNAILLKLPTYTPELTDHTENNILVRLLSVWAGITEMLSYYIDNIAREVFLSTARRYDSAIKISKLFDYRIRGLKPSSVDLTFTLNQAHSADIAIPANTLISTQDNIVFATIESATILAGETSIIITAAQQELQASVSLGNSTGLPDQIFTLVENIADTSITVTVGAVQYSFVPSLAFTNATDEVFTSSLNNDGIMEIRFGNGIQGFIPPTGQAISVLYATTLGASGNIASNTINNLVSTIVLPVPLELSVTNISNASGGANAETLEDLRKNIPLSIRTLNRAVTPQDYIDIAELQPGVNKATVLYECGTEVDIYIVPEGGGLASQNLINDVLDAFYDETKLILLDVNVLSAGELLILLQVDVFVQRVYNKIVVEESVKTNLANAYSVNNQDISGEIHLGDIYQVIENTDGVDHCLVKLITVIPTSRILDGSTNLNWVRVLNETSTEVQKWEIKYLDNDEFELTRNSVLIGLLQLNQTYNFPSISFTILDSPDYTLGDRWEFVTYPYNESTIDLDEPSIPILLKQNINLTMIGGV